MQTKEDVIRLIQNDAEMMEIIKTADTLNLPDWWICAGFVRSKIWDTIHGFNERTRTPDIDVIYYDPVDIDELIEKELESMLRGMMPSVPWSVKNQARMHIINNCSPYASSEDAISKFPETATAIGVTLNKNKQLVLTAPWGLDDVINLDVKPTPFYKETKERAAIYEKRVLNKNWKSIWFNINVHPPVLTINRE